MTVPLLVFAPTQMQALQIEGVRYAQGDTLEAIAEQLGYLATEFRQLGAEDMTVAVGYRYKIHRLLGEGCFSIVFQATDAYNREERAIKTFRRTDQWQNERDFLRRVWQWQDEADRAKVVRLYRWMEADPQTNRRACLVLEPLGPSLGQVMATYMEARLTWATLRELARHTLEAVETMHRHHIIHKDIKPDNLVLETTEVRVVQLPTARVLEAPSWRLKVIDLSSATTLEAAEHDRLDANGCDKMFCAPELIVGADADAAIDVFAAGLTLLTVASGREPIRLPVVERGFNVPLHIAVIWKVLMRPGETFPVEEWRDRHARRLLEAVNDDGSFRLNLRRPWPYVMTNFNQLWRLLGGTMDQIDAAARSLFPDLARQNDEINIYYATRSMENLLPMVPGDDAHNLQINQLKDLVRQLTRPSAVNRLTATQALQHIFLTPAPPAPPAAAPDPPAAAP